MEKITSRACLGMYKQAITAGMPPGWVPMVANEFGSDQASEEYPWLSATPALQEWVGQRNAKGFKENGITVVNKHFESTLEIQKKDLRRDKFGMLRARINEQVRRAYAHPATLLSTLILNGEAGICYDDNYFFAADHEEGKSGVQSNDLSVDISALPVVNHGTPTLPSIAELQLAIGQSIAAIVSYKDDAGEPMNEDASSFLIMVPPTWFQLALQAVATPVQIAESQTVLSGLKQKFSISIESNPRLSSWTTKLATFRTDAYIKPLIYQRETEFNVGAKAEGSEFEFDTDMHQYGLDYWGNVAYGLWQQACLITLI